MLVFLPSAAQGADTIAFLDTRDLVVRITPSQQTATSVLTLVNSGSAPRDVSLQVVGVQDATGQDVPSTSLASVSPAMEVTIRPGRTFQFKVTWTRRDHAGNYMGELVAVANDGSVARLGVTVAIDEATVPSVAALTPPLTDSVTITGTNFGFASVRWQPHLNSVSLPLRLPAREQVVGLVSGDGSIGQLVEDKSGRIAVRGISRSGTYSGSLDLRPGATGGEAKITVRIRDWILPPIVVLAIALGFSYWIDRWARVGRPRQRLKIALSGLKDQGVQEQNAELKSKKSHPEDWPFKDDVYRVYVPPATTTPAHGVLQTVAGDALKSFNDADSDDERAKWGPGGDELKRVTEYVTKLGGMYATSHVIAEAGVSLRWLHRERPHPGDKPLEDWFVLQEAAAALKPRVLENDPQFTRLQGELKNAASFITPFVEVYVRLERLLVEDPGTAPAVDPLRLQLIDATTPEDVAKISAEVDKIHPHPKLMHAPMLMSSAAFDLELGHTPVISAWIRAGEIRGGELVRFPGALRPVRPKRQETTNDLKRRLRWRDYLLTWATSAITVITGLSVLYFANPTFGSWADYVALFVWGLGIDATLKLTRRLGPGIAAQLAS